MILRCIFCFLMASLVALMVITLNGCCGDFKPGDCVVSGDYVLYKILKVGPSGGYLVEDVGGTITNWHALKGGFSSTSCFNSFANTERTRVDSGIADPDVLEFIHNYDYQSESKLTNCIQRARAISDVLYDLLHEHVRFTTNSNDDRVEYQNVDYDKTKEYIGVLKKNLMDACPKGR